MTIGKLAACSSAMCGRRTHPRTDVDPPRVELPSAGAYRLAVPGGDNSPLIYPVASLPFGLLVHA